MTSAAIHHRSLVRFAERWKTLYSDVTCLSCLRRTPQHRFPCGHCLCENCVQIYGDTRPSEPWMFRVQFCFLCTSRWPEEIGIKINEPTKGVSVLSIDGGGTRGIIPLTIMRRIQQRIGIPIPFQKYFKVVAGVSSGEMENRPWPIGADVC